MGQQLQQPSAGGIGQQSQFGRQPESQFGRQPQPGTVQQPQTGLGQPPQVGRQQAGQATPPSLEQYEKTMPSEFRVALHDFNTLAEVADWCRDQCLDKQGMTTVVRTCEDLMDVAQLNEKLVAHDSEYGPHVAEAFLKVAKQSIRDLQEYEQDPNVADTIPVIERAVESTEKLLRSVGWQSPEVGSQVGQQTTGQVGTQSRYGRSGQVGQQSCQSYQQVGQTPQQF